MTAGARTLALRVLVIDDDDDARLLLRRGLRDVDDVVLCGEARTGEEGLRRLPHAQPDVVVSDWFMPGLDGIATVAAVRRWKPTVAILAWTSSPDPAVARDFRRAGAARVFAKHEWSALIAHLRRLATGSVD